MNTLFLSLPVSLLSPSPSISLSPCLSILAVYARNFFASYAINRLPFSPLPLLSRSFCHHLFFSKFAVLLEVLFTGFVASRVLLLSAFSSFIPVQKHKQTHKGLIGSLQAKDNFLCSFLSLSLSSSLFLPSFHLYCPGDLPPPPGLLLSLSSQKKRARDNLTKKRRRR